MTPIETAEMIGKVAGAALGVFGVIVSVVKAVKWTGASVSGFITERVVPPIEKLTASVEDLSTRTHENTVSMRDFADEQRKINQDTAVKIAEVRGHLGMDV